MWETILIVLVLGFAFVGVLVSVGGLIIYCLQSYQDYQYRKSRNEHH
jgi:hypothetical protein